MIKLENLEKKINLSNIYKQKSRPDIPRVSPRKHGTNCEIEQNETNSW